MMLYWIVAISVLCTSRQTFRMVRGILGEIAFEALPSAVFAATPSPLQLHTAACSLPILLQTFLHIYSQLHLDLWGQREIEKGTEGEREENEGSHVHCSPGVAVFGTSGRFLTVQYTDNSLFFKQREMILNMLNSA